MDNTFPHFSHSTFPLGLGSRTSAFGWFSSKCSLSWNWKSKVMSQKSHLLSLRWEFLMCHFSFPAEMKVFLQDLHIIILSSLSEHLLMWFFNPPVLLNDFSQEPHCIRLFTSSSFSLGECFVSISDSWVSITWVLRISIVSNSNPQNPHWQIFFPSWEHRMCLFKCILSTKSSPHWLHLVFSQSWESNNSLLSKLFKHFSHFWSFSVWNFRTWTVKFPSFPKGVSQVLHLKFLILKWTVS